MGKVILVTGGVRSGKSLFAEELAKKIGENILYIATAIPYDDEMRERIDVHKMFRPVSWTTYEVYKDLHEVIDSIDNKQDGILLDCVTIMITNLMFDYPSFDENNIGQSIIKEINEYIIDEFCKLLNFLKKRDINIIMVTNEIGWGLVPESKLGRVFRDISGKINQLLAREAEEVYLLVSGIPMKIK
ncbi:bifunctional adenosylcobinamide kinase/adenosylcobinamide-phosphate guanylyltransferase [Serpentinicella alkaliphila]|uniref:Adenosylcobinamide kinase n=1 Tax=Serpentinicella alkaliphila TaxID=1734049 RepID=A0A4R2TKG5_9FIRM|nr:bifunctional adenosylcobinamide kinase/adenosylcobinamide-phosphate guanylyltransferase [Serpentinicella alkaliphila]QUH24436.1 bifunctional adenosylcobinamide kinase/adenosylcobinamide-phosphate guanylyltransferase [Serpentinicella alkaliphila]TCQ04170.1 adenosylcobinamide kinase /adenosylcobinamide-phosphate guanylyltransferase [Serpentinicella alkaliphila]